jgi:hypothetical protein
MKQKPTKLQQLFEGHRRKASLVAWSHLRTKAGESRIKLDLRIPLSNEPSLGMNDAIAEGFLVMAKDESKIDRTSLSVELEGMTLESFTTDAIKHPSVVNTGVKFQKLALVAAGEGDKRTIDLLMIAYVPASIQLRDWAWENLHATFFLESVYSQSEMEWVGEAEVANDDPDTPEDDESDEDQDDEEDDSEDEE